MKTLSYDNPLTLSYHFQNVDFGASNVVQTIATPKPFGVGLRGRVAGATVYAVTEDFAGSTTDAGVRVGDGVDDDVYFDSGLVLDESVDIGDSLWLADDGAQVDIEPGRDTVTVTFVAAVGTPTGQASVAIVINYW